MDSNPVTAGEPQDVELIEGLLTYESATQQALSQELAVFQDYMKEDYLAQSKIGWEKKIDKKDFGKGFKMQAWVKKVNGLNLVRTDTEILNANVAEVVAIIVDPTIDPDVKDYQVLQKYEDGTEIQYLRIKIPIPMMSDRDCVVQSQQQQVDKGIFLYSKSVVNENMPEVKGVVRMDVREQATITQVDVDGQPSHFGQNVKIVAFEYDDVKSTILNSFDKGYQTKQAEQLVKAIVQRRQTVGNGVEFGNTV